MCNEYQYNYQPIISVLSYFQVFKHPLTAADLAKFTGVEIELVERRLEWLSHKVHIQHFEGYYGLAEVRPNVIRRKRANQRADKLRAKAIKRGQFIEGFPFVEAVFISGSLSKGVMYPDGDVDFFVITKPNRLWISRMLLMLFKKVFLFNSRKFFCINYYVSSNALEIEEQNLFTATEVVTAMPVSNSDWHQKFLNANTWVKEFYPLSAKSNTSNLMKEEAPKGLWNTIDNWCMALTKAKWRTKFKSMSSADFKLAMKSTKTVSKHHPHNYQKKVLDHYAALYHQVAAEVAQTECADERVV